MTNIQDKVVVPVPLGDRSYNITILPGLIGTAECAESIQADAPFSQACIVTHPSLAVRYAQPLLESLSGPKLKISIVTVPAGEGSKNLRQVAKLYDAFLVNGLDRKSLVIAVGGGVLGDLVGFAAASYLRGIRFIQVPTTLLAQVDASVGGKTGVDLPQGKNLVGAFHQPSAVLIDPITLQTLPRRELRAGLAEIVKYGIIYDKDYFEEVVRSAASLLKCDQNSLVKIIARSCEIKSAVVSNDETEQGQRAILNFGHTIGHALEAVTQYKRYKHGEAVAIGMFSEALIGEEHGITPPHVTRRLMEALKACQLPVDFPKDIALENILSAALTDKKTLSGKLHFVLPQEIGSVIIAGDVPEKTIIQALQRHIDEI